VTVVPRRGVFYTKSMKVETANSVLTESWNHCFLICRASAFAVQCPGLAKLQKQTLKETCTVTKLSGLVEHSNLSARHH
jgi:hypothetical protein